MKKGLFMIIALLIMLSCHRKHPVSGDKNNLSEMISEYEKWKKHRHNSLIKPDSWLSLVGLSWLKAGENLMGSGSQCNIRLSQEYPEMIGRYLLNDSVVFETLNDEHIFHNKNRFYSGQMQPDTESPYTILTFQSLSWYIIERDNKYGVRIKDSLSTTRTNFKGIEYFPYTESMVLEAEVIETGNDSVQITNVLGFQSQNRVEAFLCFSRGGKDYKLAALDGGPLYYFLIISDNTTGFSTYGGGRYVSVPKPNPGESRTRIDFNRSINPPCVFTDYATCPLPPQSNHLFFEVRAGEKKFHH